ncbi:hypothetical protein SCYAM73S_03727 [Streptomyces cyaneofuscatus]
MENRSVRKWARQPVDGLLAEEGGRVLEGQGQPVVPLVRVEGEVEAGDAVPQVERCPGGARELREVLPGNVVEHGLDDGRARGVTAFEEVGDHVVEGVVLVLQQPRHGPVDSGALIAYGGGADQGHPAGERVHQHAHRVEQCRIVPPHRGHADEELPLPAQPGEEDTEDGGHEDRARHPGRGGGLAHPAHLVPVEFEEEGVPGVGLEARTAEVRGQLQRFDVLLQHCAPVVRRLLGGGTGRVLPRHGPRDVRRQSGEQRDVLRDQRVVDGHQVTHEDAQRPAVGRDVVVRDDQNIPLRGQTTRV